MKCTQWTQELLDEALGEVAATEKHHAVEGLTND